MSVAFYIVIERSIEAVDPFVNGKALGHCDQLDQLAEMAGVPPLMDFCSGDPEEIAEFLEQEGLATDEEIPAEEWFAAEAGLTTVRGLLSALAANPEAVPNPEEIADDLHEFETVLQQLIQAGVRWHLAVDY
ncbi:MAG: hypothetical protein KME35_08640 [Aphanocapsa sp. GSE-SYN-MK-11-07L]|jgi:hypothetical protein|nr:hypothetical protein [Aphanocapsa sp. GSE-SYN-MK-11-07L]